MRSVTPGVLLCFAAIACGGKLAPVDGGAALVVDGGAGTDAADATTAEAGDGGDAGEVEGAVPCDYDASEDASCTPPADDLLEATPPSITVAAGSYGIATFTATGPWVDDPTMFMRFESSTLPLGNLPEVLTYGSPQALPFLVAAGTSAGQQGTLTVSGHAGNITRTAQVSVTVTSCQPWPPSMVCAPSENCGFEGNGCGGLLSCGSCSGQTPYCFLGTCQATMPTYCPPDYGLGDNGACVPCQITKTCLRCSTGYCVGIQDVCICEPPPGQ